MRNILNKNEWYWSVIIYQPITHLIVLLYFINLQLIKFFDENHITWVGYVEILTVDLNNKYNIVSL